jgi:hypothetical protein
MPRRNHSHRLHGPLEDRVEYPTGGREDQEHDEQAAWSSDEAGRVGAFVGRNPATTVLTSFGIGFGFGLFVTLLLTRRESNWFERYAPQSIQDLPDTLKHLPDRLKQVPESLASYVPSSWKRW